MSDKEQKLTNENTKSDKEMKGEEIKKSSPSSSKEVSIKAELTEKDLATLDYADFSTPARMLALGTVLCKSQLVPLKKAEDVVVALMTGKELGLPFITSVSQIYPINGRPTLGVHIQRAILLQNKIIIEKIEDAVGIYEFAKTDEQGKTIYKEVNTAQGVKQVPIILGTGTAEEQPKNSSKRLIDTRTTYKFIREIKMPSGKYKEQTATSSFTLSEATQAELMDKDVWKKYWKRMLDARAFTIGAKEIADDLILGLASPNELSSDFYINENGEEVHTATIVN